MLLTHSGAQKSKKNYQINKIGAKHTSYETLLVRFEAVWRMEQNRVAATATVCLATQLCLVLLRQFSQQKQQTESARGTYH